MKRTSKRNEEHAGTPFVLYIVIALLVALFLPASAMAHKPIFVEESIQGFNRALEIPDPEISYAVYGELKRSGQVDVYKVKLESETPFYVRIAVPKKGANADYKPAFVLFGPELPQSNEPPNFPLELPEDMGRGIFLAKEEADEYFEPFTQTTLIQRQYMSRTLKPGTYYIAVYHTEGKTGKYVLTTGSRDEFGLKDWLSLPSYWYNVRMWYDPVQTQWILAGVTLAVLAAAGYLARRRFADT